MYVCVTKAHNDEKSKIRIITRQISLKFYRESWISISKHIRYAENLIIRSKMFYSVFKNLFWAPSTIMKAAISEAIDLNVHCNTKITMILNLQKHYLIKIAPTKNTMHNLQTCMLNCTRYFSRRFLKIFTKKLSNL